MADNSINTEHWQENRSSLKCNQYMLENQVVCDVMFKFQNEKDEVICTIGAHRYILMSRSAVFFALFKDSYKEKSGEIIIKDIEGEPFRQLLSYLYMDVVILNGRSVMGILYAAKKYMVPLLEMKCRDFIEDHLNNSSVFEMLEQAININDDQVVTMALDLIDESIEELLVGPAFKDISHKTLCSILKRDTLSVDEEDLLSGCLEWAGYRCLEQGIPISNDKIYEILGEALYLIRFSVMKIKPKCIITNSLISPSEIVSAFHHGKALLTEKPDVQLRTDARSGRNWNKVLGTGMKRCAVQDGEYTYTSSSIECSKSITVQSIYFAYSNQEFLDKLQVKVEYKDKKIQASNIRKCYKIAGIRLAKAIFDKGVDFDKDLINSCIVIKFDFTSPVDSNDIIKFHVTPAILATNDVKLRGDTCYHFMGLSYREKHK